MTLRQELQGPNNIFRFSKCLTAGRHGSPSRETVPSPSIVDISEHMTFKINAETSILLEIHAKGI